MTGTIDVAGSLRRTLLALAASALPGIVLAAAPACGDGGTPAAPDGSLLAVDGAAEGSVLADAADATQDAPTHAIGDAGDAAAAFDAGPAISARGFHSCFASGGTVKCWGANAFGELGNGTHMGGRSPTPTPVRGISGGVAHGVWHACGFAGTQPNCWGSNSNDELGHDQGPELAAGDAGDGSVGIWFNRPSTSLPVPVPGLTGASSFTLGYEYSCALSTPGTVSCWGADLHGVLGRTSSDGGTVCIGITGGPCSAAPLPIPTLANISEISASESATVCALRSTDGTVWCWGDNQYGELGQTTADGGSAVDTNPHPTPASVPGLQNVRHVVSGDIFRCAILSDATVSCWGENSSGQLGRDPAADPNCGLPCAGPPAVVSGLTNVRELGLGEGFACALRTDDTVLCWGGNNFGQLARDPSTPLDAGGPRNFTPQAVAGLANVAHIAVGAAHACALRRDGTVLCWGDDESGELGPGVDGGSTFTPTVVSGL